MENDEIHYRSSRFCFTLFLREISTLFDVNIIENEEILKYFFSKAAKTLNNERIETICYEKQFDLDIEFFNNVKDFFYNNFEMDLKDFDKFYVALFYCLKENSICFPFNFAKFMMDFNYNFEDQIIFTRNDDIQININKFKTFSSLISKITGFSIIKTFIIWIYFLYKNIFTFTMNDETIFRLSDSAQILDLNLYFLFISIMIILSNDKNVFYLDLRFFDKIKERPINSMNNIINILVFSIFSEKIKRVLLFNLVDLSNSNFSDDFNFKVHYNIKNEDTLTNVFHENYDHLINNILKEKVLYISNFFPNPFYDPIHTNFIKLLESKSILHKNENNLIVLEFYEIKKIQSEEKNYFSDLIKNIENFIYNVKKFIEFFNSFKNKHEFFKIELSYGIFRIYYSNYNESVCYKISSKNYHDSNWSKYKNIFEEDKQFIIMNLLLKLVNNLNKLYMTLDNGFDIQLFDFYSDNYYSDLNQELMLKSKIFNQAVMQYIHDNSDCERTKKYLTTYIESVNYATINIFDKNEDFKFYHFKQKVPALFYEIIKNLNHEFSKSFDQILFHDFKNIIFNNFNNKLVFVKEKSESIEIYIKNRFEEVFNSLIFLEHFNYSNVNIIMDFQNFCSLKSFHIEQIHNYLARKLISEDSISFMMIFFTLLHNKDFKLIYKFGDTLTIIPSELYLSHIKEEFGNQLNDYLDIFKDCFIFKDIHIFKHIYNVNVCLRKLLSIINKLLENKSNLIYYERLVIVIGENNSQVIIELCNQILSIRIVDNEDFYQLNRIMFNNYEQIFFSFILKEIKIDTVIIVLLDYLKKIEEAIKVNVCEVIKLNKLYNKLCKNNESPINLQEIIQEFYQNFHKSLGETKFIIDIVIYKNKYIDLIKFFYGGFIFGKNEIILKSDFRFDNLYLFLEKEEVLDFQECEYFNHIFILKVNFNVLRKFNHLTMIFFKQFLNDIVKNKSNQNDLEKIIRIESDFDEAFDNQENFFNDHKNNILNRLKVLNDENRDKTKNEKEKIHCKCINF